MISPHLIQIKSSYSHVMTPGSGGIPSAKEKAQELWGESRPILVIPSQNNHPKWCHMILAGGPVIEPNSDPYALVSHLVIIWWSEMSPDTDRVLSAIDWEKHAKNFPNKESLK